MIQMLPDASRQHTLCAALQADVGELTRFYSSLMLQVGCLSLYPMLSYHPLAVTIISRRLFCHAMFCHVGK